eukprot:2340282-Pleurochrysis_carterae.AAC.1
MKPRLVRRAFTGICRDHQRHGRAYGPHRSRRTRAHLPHMDLLKHVCAALVVAKRFRPARFRASQGASSLCYMFLSDGASARFNWMVWRLSRP